jgi:hypothetical protein
VRRLRWVRALFVFGLPLAIGLHMGVSRSEEPLLRAGGMAVIMVWLLLYTYLAHAACARCGDPFFGAFVGSIFCPTRLLTRRAHCRACDAELRSR